MIFCVSIIALGFVLSVADPCTKLDIALGINIGSRHRDGICTDLFWAESGDRGGIHSVLSLENPVHYVTLAYASASMHQYRSHVNTVVLPRFSALFLGNWVMPHAGLADTLKKVQDRFPSPDAVFLSGTGMKHDPGSAVICDFFRGDISRYMTSQFFPVVGDLRRGECPHIECPYEDWKQSQSNFSFHRFKAGLDMRVCFWILDTNPENWNQRSAKWLDQSLARHARHCTWTIVTGHHAVYVAGAQHKRMQTSLLPILEAHDVDMYISSSRRQTQILKNSKEHTIFFVSGASGMADPETEEHPFLEYQMTTRVAFLELQFAPKKISYSLHFGDNTAMASPFHKGLLFQRDRNSVDAVPHDPLRIVAFGDWGQPGEQWDQTLTNLRNRQKNFDRVFLLGDNFYPNGVDSTADSQWERFEALAHVLPSKFQVVLGNHDYLGNIEAQIDYSHDLWSLPTEYYFKKISKGSITVCVWALDTNEFNLRQSSWFAASLQQTTGCMYKVVMGHHPVVTGGVYMHSVNIAALRKTLLPLLAGVSLYIAGHEHMSQILASPDGGALFLIAGATSDLLSPTSGDSHPWAVFTDTTKLATLEIDFGHDFAQIQFVTTDNRIIWTGRVGPCLS